MEIRGKLVFRCKTEINHSDNTTNFTNMIFNCSKFTPPQHWNRLPREQMAKSSSLQVPKKQLTVDPGTKKAVTGQRLDSDLRGLYQPN